MGWLFALIGIVLDWVPPQAPPPAISIHPAAGAGEEQYLSPRVSDSTFSQSSSWLFPSWRAIGWFNTMMTGKRRQAANCVQSHLN